MLIFSLVFRHFLHGSEIKNKSEIDEFFSGRSFNEDTLEKIISTGDLWHHIHTLPIFGEVISIFEIVLMIFASLMPFIFWTYHSKSTIIVHKEKISDNMYLYMGLVGIWHISNIFLSYVLKLDDIIYSLFSFKDASGKFPEEWHAQNTISSIRGRFG